MLPSESVEPAELNATGAPAVPWYGPFAWAVGGSLPGVPILVPTVKIPFSTLVFGSRLVEASGATSWRPVSEIGARWSLAPVTVYHALRSGTRPVAGSVNARVARTVK